MARQQHKPCENNIPPCWKRMDFQLLEYDVASPGFPMCQIDFYLRYGTKQHSYEPMLHWRPSKMASLWPISVFRTPYYSEKNNFIKNKIIQINILKKKTQNETPQSTISAIHGMKRYGKQNLSVFVYIYFHPIRTPQVPLL